jgi:Ser/Thr protein kinase RdoA (MazF antagonist)
MKAHMFQERIGYKGDIKPILSKVCEDYSIGKYKTHSVVPVGYEDFNLILTTDKDKFFVKIFAIFRELKNREQRSVDIMRHVLDVGVQHPKLYKSSQGYLHKIKISGTTFKLCVMQYIEGKSFHELKAKPTVKEAQFLIQQAALINSVDLKPSKLYDMWAIANFLREYEQKKKYLTKGDVELVEPLVKPFAALDVESLPHCLVHGDIISTNVMKDKQGELYIIDFSVANYYPRIQELAVLLCDLLFDPKSPAKSGELYDFALAEYQKYIPLSPKERSALPLYVRVGHAMHILGASTAIAKSGNFPENQYWLSLGRAGLEGQL